MNSKTTTEAFRRIVGICNRFISLRPNLPVLANIKIESQKTKLILTATNLENSVIIETPSSGEVWETTVPAKLLFEFLNLVKGSETKIDLDKESLGISCEGSKGTFNTIAASEFPKIGHVKTEGATIAQRELQTAIQNIAFAASADEGKPVLNGVLLRSKGGKTNLVATDSYRLALFQLREDYNLAETIIPARAFSEAVKIAGELGEETIILGVSPANNQLVVTGESFQITTRLIDGVYPAFEQIIPTTFVCEVAVAKDALVAAIKQAAVFARDMGNVVKLFITQKSGIKIWASTKQVGEGTTTVKAEVSGENIEVAFNSHFLLEGLEAVNGQEVKLKLSGSLKPTLIMGESDKSFDYIVMPVKPQS